MSASPGRGRPPNTLPDLYRPVSNGYPGSSSTQYQPPLHQAPSSTNSVSSPGTGGGSGVVAIPISNNAIPVASPAYPYSDRSTTGTYVGPPPGESVGNGIDGVGQQQLTAIDQPNANAESLEYCTTSCASIFCKWFVMYIILITAAALITARFLPELGLFLLSVLPAITLLSFLEMQFRKSVIRMQVRKNEAFQVAVCPSLLLPLAPSHAQSFTPSVFLHPSLPPSSTRCSSPSSKPSSGWSQL